MAVRTPRVWNATIELGFVLIAGVLGAVKAPFWGIIAVALAMIGYWMWNRRAGLAQLAQGGAVKFAAMAGISLALIIAVLACAYWFGGVLGGITK
jgi:hypothetical protein